APVVDLSWSCDSELLAVVTAPARRDSTAAAAGAAAEEQGEQQADGAAAAEAEEDTDDWVVQLWHRSNWHWYLKHERRYPRALAGPSSASLPPHVRWDEQAGSVLHVLTPGGLYEQIGLVWDTCVSERGTAVVVDGRRLLLTPLRHGLVPPPMCAAGVALPEAAVDVCIGSLPAPGSCEGAGAAAAAGGGSGCCPPGDAAAEENGEEDEVVAALTSRGRLVLVRSVEGDLWQESLEDQEALAAETSGRSGNPASTSSTATRLLQPAVPLLDIPLAGGRRARALCWLTGSSSLLVLATPYPEPGLEEAPGDVLVQVDVEWLSCGPADPSDPRVSPAVALTEGPAV
ncbi:hypothetical protein Agub_g4057, partial [Astrephomene gubernaculifera]